MAGSATRWDRDQARIRAICARLTRDGVVEPLADRGDDNHAWNGWELASLIEVNLGRQIDVGSLSDDQRTRWELRASWDHRPLRRPHGEYRLPHWLLEDGVRVGTISFATMYGASSLFDVSSLFVAPAFRGRGIARRALGIQNAKRILNEGKASVGSGGPEPGTTEEFDWLRHPPESARGKWVALVGSEMVGLADQQLAARGAQESGRAGRIRR